MIKILTLLGILSLCTLLLVQVHRQIIIMDIQIPGFGKIFDINTPKLTTTQSTFQIQHFDVFQKQKYEHFYEQRKTQPVSYTVQGKKIEINSGTQKYVVSKYPFANNIQKIQKINSQKNDAQTYIFWHSTFHTLYYAQEKNSKELHSCLTIQHEKSNNQKNFYFAIDSNHVSIFSLVMERVLLIQLYSCSQQKVIQKIKIPFKRQITQQMDTKTGGYHKFQKMFVELGLLEQGVKLSVKVSLLSISTDIVNADIKFVETADGKQNIQVSDFQWQKSYQIKNNTNELVYKLHYPSQLITNFYKTVLLQFITDLLYQLKQIYTGSFNSDQVVITKQQVANYLKTQFNSVRKIRQERVSLILQYQSQDSLLYLLGTQGLNKTSTVLKLGKHMNSIQTPIFYDTDSPKASKKNTEIIQRYLSPNITIEEFKKFSLFDYKYFQFKQKTHEQLNSQLSVQDQLQIKELIGYTVIPLYPVAETFWFALTSTGSSFVYPVSNMKEKQFKYIRTSTGAIIMEGYKFKGKYDNLPRIDGEVYLKISDKNNIMYLPNIYPIHLVYKHLISYPKLQKKSPCLQLINALAGKSVLTHYLFPKDKFELLNVYLQNNEWIISQYDKVNQQTHLSKYQIFFNNSNIKQVLYVKRDYVFPEGKIHSLIKCIDGFYYMEVQTRVGTLGYMRVPYQALNNRRASPTTKYSGLFDQQISLSGEQQYRQSKLKPKKRDFPIGIQQYYFDIFENEKNTLIQTNVVYPKTKEQRQTALRSIKPAFQYDILPYSIYQNHQTQNLDSFYVFNVRKLWIEATLIQIQQIQRDVVLGIGMTALLFWFIAVAILIKSRFAEKSSSEKPVQEKSLQEKTPKADEQRVKKQESGSKLSEKSSPSSKSSKNKKKKAE